MSSHPTDLLRGPPSAVRPEKGDGNTNLADQTLSNRNTDAEEWLEQFNDGHGVAEALSTMPTIPGIKSVRVDAKQLKQAESSSRWKDALHLATSHHIHRCIAANHIGYAISVGFADILVRERTAIEADVAKLDQAIKSLGIKVVWEGGPKPFTWGARLGIAWYGLWYLLMHVAGFWVAKDYLTVVNPDAEFDWALVLAPVVIQFGLSVMAVATYTKPNLVADEHKRSMWLWGWIISIVLGLIGVVQYMTMGDGTVIPQSFNEAQSFTGEIGYWSKAIETIGFACRFWAEVTLSTLFAIKGWEIFTGHGTSSVKKNPAETQLRTQRQKLVKQLATINNTIAKMKAFVIGLREEISVGCETILGKLGHPPQTKGTYRDAELEKAYATLAND